ncbi:MAG: IPT/TIG domain-containing protein, partial [Planctomycetes bacterium]|nr:IPT/TIG domain-containing protein [Planctomycetota bacterium]
LEGEYGYATLVVQENPFKIFSVFPVSGDINGGERVTIHGEGFASQEYPEVWFGEYQAAEVTVIDDQTIETVSPPNLRGMMDVLIKEADIETLSLSALKKDAFEYQGESVGPPIEFEVLSPSHGPAGREIIIKGKYFLEPLQIFINSQSVAYTLLSSREISFHAPDLAENPYDITLVRGEEEPLQLSDALEITKAYLKNSELLLPAYSTVVDTINVTDDFLMNELYFYIDFDFTPTDIVDIILTSPQGTQLHIFNNVYIAEKTSKGVIQWVDGLHGWMGADFHKGEDFASYPGSESFSKFFGESAKGLWTLTFKTEGRSSKDNPILHTWGLEFLIKFPQTQPRSFLDLIFTINEYRHSLMAIDPFTEKPIYHTILGDNPYDRSYYGEEISVSPDNTQVWTAPHYGKGLDIFEPLTGQQIQRIELFNGQWGYFDIRPGDIIFNAESTKAYIHRRYDSQQLLVYSTSSFQEIGRIDFLDGADQTGIALASSKLYVLKDFSGTNDLISVYDAGALTKIKDISTFPNPRRCTVSDDGTLLFVTTEDYFATYDTVNETLLNNFLFDGRDNYGLVVTKDNSVSFGTKGTWYAGLSIIDIPGQNWSRENFKNPYLTTFNKPAKFDFASFGESIVIGNWFGDEIYIVDPQTNKRITQFQQGPDPGYYIKSLDVFEKD